MISARSILPAVLTAALAVPASASGAANVTVADGGMTVLVQDTTATANTLHVATTADTVTITESEASGLTAGSGCTDSGLVVTCPATGISKVELRLGPGDDTTLPGNGSIYRATYGGSGDDVLDSAGPYQLLDGGADDDVLVAAGGDDDLHGGDGFDVLDYADATRSVTANIPETTSTEPLTGNGSGGENDRIYNDLEGIVGSPHDDDLDGSNTDNLLVGGSGNDDLTTGNGNDHLDGGSGKDLLWAGGGDDHIDADDGEIDDGNRTTSADWPIRCSVGENDTIDADNGLDFHDGCETVAPELATAPTLSGGPFRPGGEVTVALPGTTGTAPTSTSTDWFACNEIDCLLVDSGPWLTHVIDEADAGRRLFARVIVENAAGADSADSELTPVVEAPEKTDKDTDNPDGQDTGSRPPRDPRRPSPKPEPTLEERLTQLTAEIARSLGILAPHATPANARRLARRKSVKFLYSVPTYGVVGLRWTVSARVARRYGVKAKGSRPVIIARGSGTGRAGTPAVIRLKATKAGRRILRRAARLRITFSARFVGGAATKDRPVTAKRAVVLRLRG